MQFSLNPIPVMTSGRKEEREDKEIEGWHMGGEEQEGTFRAQVTHVTER
jgi:hypothetical protein